MSQIITRQFATYLRDCLASKKTVVLDEFVLANIPGLDPGAQIEPSGGLPPAELIVHRQNVDRRGRINNDAVAYTIVMDTTVGDFEFNAMYLINKAEGLVGMIVYKGLETKTRTVDATGQTGNSLVKSMLMEFHRASEVTATHVDASTWQIDYYARLRGMDDDIRLQALQFFGKAAFYGNGFKVVTDAGMCKVLPGVAYVGGLRAQLDEIRDLYVGQQPASLWIDIYRAGSLLDAWVNYFTLTTIPAGVADPVDYVDSNGYEHYVAKVATLNADGSGAVLDERRQSVIELSGDVRGRGIIEDGQVVNISVQILDNSHRHDWSELNNAPATMPPSAHKHRWGELEGVPATMPPSAHKHSWLHLEGVPETANRWPKWWEVGGIPQLISDIRFTAMTVRTHSEQDYVLELGSGVIVTSVSYAEFTNTAYIATRQLQKLINGQWLTVLY